VSSPWEDRAGAGKPSTAGLEASTAGRAGTNRRGDNASREELERARERASRLTEEAGTLVLETRHRAAEFVNNPRWPTSIVEDRRRAG
jgi:hypothetical protein